MSRAIIRAFVLLSSLQSVAAIVAFDGARVYDYKDIPPASSAQKGPTFKTTAGNLYAYATCDASADIKYMKNIVISDWEGGVVLTTLADLVLNQTDKKTGLKTAQAIPINVNYTIRDINPEGTARITFYFYITQNTATVYDANYARRVNATGVTMVMTPFEKLSLRNFDTGKASTAMVSISPPEGDKNGDVVAFERDTASLSIAKLFGPIASIRTKPAQNDFSFEIDNNNEATTNFTAGALLGYVSPGYSGVPLYPYAHPLYGAAVDITLKADTGNFWATAAVEYLYTVDASIAYEDGDATPFVGDSGTKRYSVFPASFIKIHWAKSGKLHATFRTSATEPTMPTPETTTSVSPTTVAWSALFIPIWAFLSRYCSTDSLIN